MRIWLKVQDTTIDSAVKRVNSTFIEAKTIPRVSERNIVYKETIPYSGLKPFREYMMTVQVDIDDNTDIKALSDTFAKKEIGLVTELDDTVSVMFNPRCVNSAITELENYGLGSAAADNAVNDVLNILIELPIP